MKENFQEDFVIFLDFDGPMFSAKSMLLDENLEQNSTKMCEKLKLHHTIKYWKMDPCSVAIINRLGEIDNNVKLVISSSWSHPFLHDREIIESLLKANGINTPLHTHWMTEKGKAHRVEEISKWLEKRYIKDYIIFDDKDSAPEMLNQNTVRDFKLLPSRIFMVDTADGLKFSDYVLAKEIIKGIA